MASDGEVWAKVRSRFPELTDERIRELGRAIRALRGKDHPYPMEEILAAEATVIEPTVQVFHDLKRTPFDFERAMAEAWEDATQDYRARGIDPEDVLARASAVIYKVRGTPASADPPEDGDL